MPSGILHITNGDSAAELIRRAGLADEVMPWRDVLHEGPVPAGLSLDALRPLRARFIAERGWGALDDVLVQFAARDRVLQESHCRDEVVLWFEHDLYDQLQLLQLLDWFAGRDGETTRLSLICGPEYLGSSTPGRLRERFPERRRITAAPLRLAQTAWAAYRSSDPRRVAGLLEEDTSALPFLGRTLRRHLQQFPSVGNGLSRSEAQALEVIARGVTRLGDVYRASHHELEEAIFLGDIVFAWYMEELSQGREPLVTGADGRVLLCPRDPGETRAFWNSHVTLTEVGRAVLAGRADRVEINGIDRWLGGVRVQGRSAHWRWHPSRGIEHHPGNDPGARRM